MSQEDFDVRGAVSSDSLNEELEDESSAPMLEVTDRVTNKKSFPATHKVSVKPAAKKAPAAAAENPIPASAAVKASNSGRVNVHPRLMAAASSMSISSGSSSDGE